MVRYKDSRPTLFSDYLSELGVPHTQRYSDSRYRSITKASKFFGLFGWSEVGFAYFSVSLATLLMFPLWTCYLALCNACCLPFTIWSIWYQKFRAGVWCTLCVCVQCTLWLLFFCYFFGGWFKGVFPLRMPLFVLGATYMAVLLALNRIMPYFDRSESE